MKNNLLSLLLLLTAIAATSWIGVREQPASSTSHAEVKIEQPKQPIDPPEVVQGNLVFGLLRCKDGIVKVVDPGLVLKKMGFLKGDQITTVDDFAVGSIDDYLNHIFCWPPRGVVQNRVNRSGKAVAFQFDMSSLAQDKELVKALGLQSQEFGGKSDGNQRSTLRTGLK